ncbi:hypothetical protein RDI58_016410 [Solanum bulbocastanum]|uniref:Uncharacterized protein n=1 Tax=Solanum bulbocastanum TaxID=147425 RepID=A0AAN8YCD0_SOLBU
MNDMIGRESHC